MVKNDIYGFLQSSAVDQEFKDEVKKLLFDSIAVQVKRWALSTDKYAVSGRDLTLAAGMWLMKWVGFKAIKALVDGDVITYNKAKEEADEYLEKILLLLQKKRYKTRVHNWKSKDKADTWKKKTKEKKEETPEDRIKRYRAQRPNYRQKVVDGEFQKIGYTEQSYSAHLLEIERGELPEPVRRYMSKWKEEEIAPHFNPLLSVLHYVYPLLQSLPYITDEYAELLLKPVNLPGTKGLVKNAAKKQLHKHMRTITPHLYNECMLENFIEKYVRISSENTREQFIDYVKYYVRQSIHAHTDKAKLNNVKSYEHRMALWADVNNTFLKNNVIHGEAEVNVPRAPYTSFEEPEDIEAIKS